MSSKLQQKKHRFKPYTEKIKKKIGICSILGHPGSRSADPDPHQNDTDPKHCF